MDKVDGGFLIVIGMLAGLSLAMFFFVWAFPWFSEPNQYSVADKPLTASETETNNQGRGDPFWIGPLRGVVYAEDTAAQWFMAGFAAFTTVASIYAVWLIRETLKYTRLTLREASDTNRAAWATVEESKRIGEAQTRAYLSVISSQLVAKFKLNHMHVEVGIRNTGQSPARSIRCHIALAREIVLIRDEDGSTKSAPIEKRYAAIFEGSPGDIPATDTHSFACLYLNTNKDERSDRVYNRIADGLITPLGGVGCLTWDDVFGNEQRVFFDLIGRNPYHEGYRKDGVEEQMEELTIRGQTTSGDDRRVSNPS